MEEKKINFLDVLADGQENETMFPSISLAKLTGKKIKDIIVSVSEEFGDPCLRISQIVFEDGSTAGCSGEHDIAYIEDDVPNIDDTALRALKKADDLWSGFGDGEPAVSESWDETTRVEIILPAEFPRNRE